MLRGWSSGGLRLAAIFVAAAAVVAPVGCGGTSQATRNRVFYDASLGDGSPTFERQYPRLDWPKSSPDPSFQGVSAW